MTVDYFTKRIPGDANHENQIAIVTTENNKRLEFYAFPFQPYFVRYKNISASVNKDFTIVNRKVEDICYVNVWFSHPDGTSTSIDHQSFANLDDAFEYATKKVFLEATG